ncbi:hypothetical protein NIES593_02930 [Hydrococcus rivularis NIES-593]|uniref:Uncharacterized protein n=1 Tax=Hydrococcus rivularis NIES-593 TaxID=1921803 RepID=A0A1U7HR75_9CYAN|nr:hypothetical protein [Hydrococcus rivularis]OKH26048.1 hypothetical protein NIES593_02930 [Hydrococcus rivularis NIES-593]
MKFSDVARHAVATSLLPFALFGCALTTAKEASPSAATKTISGLQLSEVEPEFQNSWTQELEAEFQQRAATVIRHFANPNGYGNGYGENEKSAYPRAMFDFLAGNRKTALAFLQQEDPQADKHAHTEGIDYYYSFTLKGQIRKYFLFGRFLDPAYKQRMYLGAKKWTQEDPLNRMHPIYGFGDSRGKEWDMSKRGGWVDSRNTDNLRAMREVAVYLMAEKTGNEKTRQLYKQKIQGYVGALYHIGMGEWDSEAYMSHTFVPYLNLYDFAKDPQVKRLAKAALDWMSAAAAVKYYRGGWGGPSKRDYGGGNGALMSSAAKTFWLYFGDTPLPNSQPELDMLHLITSTYRPPQAVVALARKQFDKPLEILATKPLYENWKFGNDEYPAYWETQFFGNTYQMGSVAGTFADKDVSPFKLMAYNSRRGVDYFVANTGGNWVHPGKNPGDQIGQSRNLLIWLRPATQMPFFFQLPKTAKAEIEGGIWFFQLEKTWLAIYPINLNTYFPIPIGDRKYGSIYVREQTFKATTKESTYAGFALEVGEPESHGSYEEFKQAVKQKSQLDLSQLNQGRVKLQDVKGNHLQLFYNQLFLLPLLIFNGKERNWSENFALYNSQTGNQSPISLGWKQGELLIKAGELQFKTRAIP